MSLYLTLETEESATHGEDDLEESERYQELLLEAGLIEDDEEKARKIAKSRMELVVCSCGSARCYMIRKFGHPRKIYTNEIEPIPGQHAKDMRALALKGEAPTS
jgi:hypothetical protein